MLRPVTCNEPGNKYWWLLLPPVFVWREPPALEIQGPEPEAHRREMQTVEPRVGIEAEGFACRLQWKPGKRTVLNCAAAKVVGKPWSC
jgi:hypothetical protein